MNILLTGASGFIGAAFLRHIERNGLFSGDRVFLLTGREIPGYRCIFHKDYSFEASDLAKAGADQIDVVVHLGSATPKTVAECGIEHIFKYMMNVRNTIHLLENLPGVLEKFIFISSTDVYDEGTPVVNEASPLSNCGAYGLSKIMCEAYLAKQARTKNFVLQILRLGYIYGPGEEVYSKIISEFMKLILAGRPVRIFGDGSGIRSMLHVDDCCRALAQAVLLPESIGPVNIVSSQRVTVKALAEMMHEVCARPMNAIYSDSKKGAKNVFEAAKMKKYFTVPEIPLIRGLMEYRDYYSGRMRDCGA